MRKTKTDIQREALIALLAETGTGIIRGTLVMSMRSGKSLTAIKAVKQIHQAGKILVAAPIVKIFDGWRSDLREHCYEELMEFFEFVTYRSLVKKDPNDYSIVILDEIHKATPKSNDVFMKKFKGHVIGLTGTPAEMGVKKRFMNRYAPVKYKYSTDDAVSDGVLNKYKVRIHLIDLNTKKTLTRGPSGREFLVSEKQDYDYLCKKLEENPTDWARLARMNALKNYSGKEEYLKALMSRISRKSIIFANTKAQADLLCEHSYHSSNKNSDKNLELLKKGEISIMSAVDQIDMGVQVPGLSQVFIMHMSASVDKGPQRLGRILTLSPEEVATCHILVYKDTVDEKWALKSLGNFKAENIKYYYNGKLL
jgi:superfamily II DNA or RNA helicase